MKQVKNIRLENMKLKSIRLKKHKTHKIKNIDKMSNICSKTGTTCIVNVRGLKTKLSLKKFKKPIKPRKTAESELFRELSSKVLAFSRAKLWWF